MFAAYVLTITDGQDMALRPCLRPGSGSAAQRYSLLHTGRVTHEAITTAPQPRQCDFRLSLPRTTQALAWRLSGCGYFLDIGLREKPAQPCGHRTEEELREAGPVAADHDDGRVLRPGGLGERLLQG